MTVFDQVPKVESIDPDKDYYSDLVGEGKKYKDNTAAGRALVEKDSFISRLESETAELRKALTQTEAELKTRTTLDEFLTKARELPPRSTESNHDSEPANGITEDKLNELIENRLTKAETQKRIADNVKIVNETLAQVWGNNYAKTLTDKAQELGVDIPFLENLAMTAPKAFFSAIGLTGKQPTAFTPPAGSVHLNTTNRSGEKTYKYYQELRGKLSKAEYYSPKVQNEIFAQAKKLGDSFYD